MWAISIPAAVQEDFLQFGWDAVVAQLPEKSGMRDAWNAVEFAMPKGSGKHCGMRLHPGLAPLLRQMLEIRWADHFQVSDELEGPYYHIIEDLQKRINANKKTKRK